jgi:lipopolysaccharide transport system ATP-binding protein
MIAVKVDRLTKVFKIPHERRNTLYERLIGLFKPLKYDVFYALKDVSFEVEKGETLGIIGENGSGKSTLLKIIARILKPTSGKVITKGKITPFLELGVGFQPDLTVVENVITYGVIMGLSQKEIKERLDDILKFAGLEDFKHMKLKNLSSGMQVRLAFSTAIQTEPDILLVDEVLAVGDLEFQQKCFDIFRRFKNEGVTILLVSHDMGAIKKFCDKALYLSKGKQLAFGDVNSVVDKYTSSCSTKNLKNKDDIKRWGNMLVEITDVKFIDKFGNESQNFFSGDPMTIRIFYNTKTEVDDVVFGIAIYRDDGLHVYGTNTMLKGIKLEKISGEGFVDLKIESLPFLRGKYHVTVAAHTKDHKPYDWRDKEFWFVIHPSTNDDGFINIPCKWKI